MGVKVVIWVEKWPFGSKSGHFGTLFWTSFDKRLAKVALWQASLPKRCQKGPFYHYLATIWPLFDTFWTDVWPNPVITRHVWSKRVKMAVLLAPLAQSVSVHWHTPQAKTVPSAGVKNGQKWLINRSDFTVLTVFDTSLLTLFVTFWHF